MLLSPYQITMTPFSNNSPASQSSSYARALPRQPLHQAVPQAYSPDDYMTPPSTPSPSPPPAGSTAVSPNIQGNDTTNNDKMSRKPSNGSDNTPPPYLVTEGSSVSSNSQGCSTPPVTNKVKAEADPLMVHHCSPNEAYKPYSPRPEPKKKLPPQGAAELPECPNINEDRPHSTLSLPALPFHSHQELSLAERSIKRLVRGSTFFPSRAARDDWFINKQVDTLSGENVTTHVSTLLEHEIRVEEMLGRGGFCEVRLAYINKDGKPRAKGSQGQKDENDECYALKYLSPTIAKRKSKKAFSRGAADLAIEARFLSLLSHTNIIHLHYVSAGSLRENYNCFDTTEEAEGDEVSQSSSSFDHLSQATGGGSSRSWSTFSEQNLRHLGYFLVLDRLHETLDHRIKHSYVPEIMSETGEQPDKHHDHHRCCTDTSHMYHSSTGIHHQLQSQRSRWASTLPTWMQNQHAAFISSNKGSPRILKKHLAMRLSVLREIASAVEYLHENKILFRDIKPDNIGFDSNDTPKLFDFGLVKELKSSSKITSLSCRNGCHAGDEAVYNLTGRTGSRRYMSPEVAFSMPYNYKADTYSFGILLYEIATLMQPFVGYTIHRHEVEVLRKGDRPCLMGYDNYFPPDLVCLIECCWAGEMKHRPNIDQIIERLDGIISELTTAESAKKREVTPPKMSARSILTGISQLQISSSRRDVVTPVQQEDSNGANYSTADQVGQSGIKRGQVTKMRQIFSSVPKSLSSSMRKNTAPSA